MCLVIQTVFISPKASFNVVVPDFSLFTHHLQIWCGGYLPGGFGGGRKSVILNSLQASNKKMFQVLLDLK